MIKRFNEFKHINEGLVDSYSSVSNFIYYTADYNKNEIIRTYKVLFDNGYKLGGRNTVEEVYERELNCTLLFIYPKYKYVLYTDAGDYDGGYSPELISELLSDYGLNHHEWYLIKNRLEFNQIFKSTININDLLNNRKNVYESVLSNLKGPSEEHILDNLMKKYEYDKKKGKGNIDQSYFVRLAIQSNNFFNYIGFILLLIEDTSWYLGHDIISSAIANNKLDVLKFTLDEDLYNNNNEQKISLLKRNLNNYKNYITDDMKEYIEGYIKKLETENDYKL